MSQMMMDPASMPPDAGGGLPPELMAALAGGGGASQDLLAQGPMAGAPSDEADAPEEPGEDPLEMVREAISLLRQAGIAESDPARAHAIDKAQADLQKILAGESQKTSKLRAALG